ncbi:MAG: MarR family transcriptional regulator, partial [Acidimicrobiales bacterium]
MSGQDQRWLTECEAKVWRSFLEMGWALDRGLDRQLTQASGLSITDYQLLVPLSESTGRQMRARD